MLCWCCGVVQNALAPAPACGLAAHTDVGPGFNSTSPARSRLPATGRETWPARQKKAARWEPFIVS